MQSFEIHESINVLGEQLEPCGMDPLTGFLRDGCCNTCSEDEGSHTVCVRVTQAFLEYSRFRGNDLTSPMLESGFPGLQPGDTWCLCAARWLEAHQQNMAPPVYLTRTHRRALDLIPLDVLKTYGLDLN